MLGPVGAGGDEVVAVGLVVHCKLPLIALKTFDPLAGRPGIFNRRCVCPVGDGTSETNVGSISINAAEKLFIKSEALICKSLPDWTRSLKSIGIFVIMASGIAPIVTDC
jgi:hypothetical protein